MIASREDLAFYVQADLAAHRLERWKAHYRLTRRIVYFQRLLRYTEYYENCSCSLPGRIWAQVLRMRLHLLGERMGFTIPRNTCGPGLSLAHKGTIVINRLARIGQNCRIHQCVTIGGGDGIAPMIGDRVMIGAGACILNGAVVGDLAVVGANSVVTKEVRAATTVGGNPARVISDRSAADRVPDWCAQARGARRVRSASG